VNPLQRYFDELAPRWDSLTDGEARRRAGEIVASVGVAPGACVLDAGCGTGILLPYLLERLGKKGRVVALDVSRGMLTRLDKADGKAQALQADAACLPLRDASFDLVFCHNVFPHFDNKPLTLRELARVLKPGGRLAITHGLGREALDKLHRRAGGAVGRHVLSSNASLRRWCAGAGLGVTTLEDKPERFVLVAEKIRG
jgi:ubiquinone/menaquinone biosynthesis C-methylase UbiE